MNKQLKTWNGRDWQCTGHVYVCAYSVKDAIVLMDAASLKLYGCVHRTSVAEIKNYWSKGCWGIAMDGIAQERGVWRTNGYDNEPERLV